MAISNTHDSPSNYLAVRYKIERVLAGAALVICAPMLLLIYCVVRLSSRGPAIYQQQRLGLNGKEFTIYKFRSMVQDAEKDSGATWSQQGDPRVTIVGRFLRWSHLDELPQLVNILRGEMAFIGPRPERRQIVFSLMLQIPCYNERLKALPGVSGLAQVTLPPDSNIRGVECKTFLDRKYIRDASLRLDLHILFSTAMLCFGLQRKISQRLWLELPFNLSRDEAWVSHQNMDAGPRSLQRIDHLGATWKLPPQPSKTNV